MYVLNYLRTTNGNKPLAKFRHVYIVFLVKKCSLTQTVQNKLKEKNGVLCSDILMEAYFLTGCSDLVQTYSTYKKT